MVGVNRSWTVYETDLHCVLEPTHIEELKQGKWTTRVLFTRRCYAENLPVETVVAVEDDAPKKILAGRWIYVTGGFAIQVARWIGFAPIYLLGFDMIQGEGKCYPTDHPPRKPNFKPLLREMNELARAVPKGKVFNCNPKSAITGFTFGKVPPGGRG